MWKDTTQRPVTTASCHPLRLEEQEGKGCCPDLMHAGLLRLLEQHCYPCCSWNQRSSCLAGSEASQWWFQILEAIGPFLLTDLLLLELVIVSCCCYSCATITAMACNGLHCCCPRQSRRREIWAFLLLSNLLSGPPTPEPNQKPADERVWEMWFSAFQPWDTNKRITWSWGPTGKQQEQNSAKDGQSWVRMKSLSLLQYFPVCSCALTIFNFNFNCL